ncbi:hypothetical protein ABFX02_08G216500 [Erythranthe guttata]
MIKSKASSKILSSPSNPTPKSYQALQIPLNNMSVFFFFFWAQANLYNFLQYLTDFDICGLKDGNKVDLQSIADLEQATLAAKQIPDRWATSAAAVFPIAQPENSILSAVGGGGEFGENGEGEPIQMRDGEEDQK